ncbi:hypothetical protein DPM13_07845 [Paracoccus mutanolyticus]|uniref:DUF1330 domain-containing protein n=1 Tax=Paracoccus mutanolyticus TaxID=1499308 RepID=A0ABM6WR13_9RHOB|nr:DUF1330 domain-containing protein [Paracoccus mutanolyticus]AWX93092.1 hypothetical protein DPM13_07845 [Paracoccus mutanolyticus]
MTVERRTFKHLGLRVARPRCLKVRRSTVMMVFADLATARACYASPEYQAARNKRDGACVAHVVIVAGV